MAEQNAQYTPGPWEVRIREYTLPQEFDGEEDTTVIEDVQVGPADRGAVCTVLGTSTTAIKPNAQLIAAAPEMLEALQSIHETMEALWPKVNWGKSFLNADAIFKLNAAPALVQKAIAKATGSEAK